MDSSPATSQAPPAARAGAAHTTDRLSRLVEGELPRRLAFGAAFLLLPFVMLSWLAPFLSKQTVGNDYSVFSLLAQLDLMWSVHKGTFPLYMPGFAGGHSTAAMTLGQLYHPISWLASLMPGYWSGLALEWDTVLRLLSLGLAHLVLYRLCRRLAMGRLVAFACTFVAAYNLRMLDSLRYGASMEAYVGMLLVAATGALVFLDERSKAKVIFLAVSTYWLCVSGHPQWAYLGLLGAVLFLLLFPWTVRVLHPGHPRAELVRVKRYVGRLGVGLGAGVLLSTPYLLTFFFEYFLTNQIRAANASYDWTLAFSDTLRGELCNFLLPLHADVHGAFGGSAFILLVALFPLAAMVRRPPLVLVFLYLASAAAFMFSAGKDLPVHQFFVKHLPLFEAFRTPGRIVIWIPLFTFPILAWLLRPANRRALGVAAGLALVLAVVVHFKLPALLPAHETFTPHELRGANIPPYYDRLILYILGGTITVLLAAAVVRRWSTQLLALSLGGIAASTWLCLSVGTWKNDKAPTRSYDQMRIDRLHSPSANSAGGEGEGMEMGAVTRYRSAGLKPEHPLGTIVRKLEPTPSEDEALRRLKADGGAAPPVFVDGPLVAGSEQDVSKVDTVRLVYNTSNRFRFEVVAAKDGYFVLGVPMLPGFVCRVDGALAKVARADLLYPSAFLPRGFHVVEFTFVSWPFLLGAAICAVTLWLLACWLAGRRGRRLVTRIVLLAYPPACVLLYFFLYGGPSFGTNYLWQGPL